MGIYVCIINYPFECVCILLVDLRVGSVCNIISGIDSTNVCMKLSR
jgi:hypothetical protein